MIKVSLTKTTKLETFRCFFGINMKEIDMNGFSIEEKDVKIWEQDYQGKKNLKTRMGSYPSEVFQIK